jgi:hypothetical protein
MSTDARGVLCRPQQLVANRDIRTCRPQQGLLDILLAEVWYNEQKGCHEIDKPIIVVERAAE